MNDFPQRLDRRTIYESSWVSLYVDRVRMPSGAIVERYHRGSIIPGHPSVWWSPTSGARS